MTLFILPAGGFFVLGAVIAVVNRLMKKKPREIGCHNCPNAEGCPGACDKANSNGGEQ